MSKYLNKQQYDEILASISIYPIESISSDKLSAYSFECGESAEYANFLFEKAERLDELGISKTFLIIHNETNELIGYFTLSADTIKLTLSEKTNSNLEDVPFMTLPAIKIGKLTINKKLSSVAARKGYGSFAIEMATAIAYKTLSNGVACRFITVDADIEYNKNTPDFYIKNGFVFNQSRKRNPSDKTISMRKDIFCI